MKKQNYYDNPSNKSPYIEELDEVELPHHFYTNAYDEVLMDDVEEEVNQGPTFWQRVTSLFISLRARSRRGQWGKISVLCSLLLAFSMLYSGDKKETLDSSFLRPASAEETKAASEMTDEELEKLRMEEKLAEKAAKRAQEDQEIVKSLQLLKEMKDREEALIKREEELKFKEGQMRTIEEGVNGRIVEMEKLKNELQNLVNMRKDLGEKSIRQLVKVYENMQPSEASTVLERVDEDIAVQVLLRMKGKKAGKILNVMKPAISVRLSEEIARRK